MNFDFTPLIKHLDVAHKNFKQVWNKYGNGFRKTEPEEITIARDKLFTAFNELFRKLDEFEKGINKNDPSDIDQIISFVEVETTAFRIGYARQRFFRRLKSTSLNESQKHRLLQVGINYCTSQDYKREFRDLVRLLIKIADKEFITKIAKIKNESDGVVKFKAYLLLETVLHHRKDLSNE
jgi:hypothetical protein